MCRCCQPDRGFTPCRSVHSQPSYEGEIPRTVYYSSSLRRRGLGVVNLLAKA